MRISIVVTTFLFLAIRASCAVSEDVLKAIKELLYDIDFEYELRSSRGPTTDYLTFCRDKFNELCLNLVSFIGSSPDLEGHFKRFKLMKWLKQPGEFAENGSNVCIVRGSLTNYDHKSSLVITGPPYNTLILVHLQKEGTFLTSADLYCRYV